MDNLTSRLDSWLRGAAFQTGEKNESDRIHPSIADRGAGLARGVGPPATGIWTKGLVGLSEGNFGQAGGY